MEWGVGCNIQSNWDGWSTAGSSLSRATTDFLSEAVTPVSQPGEVWNDAHNRDGARDPSTLLFGYFPSAADLGLDQVPTSSALLSQSGGGHKPDGTVGRKRKRDDDSGPVKRPRRQSSFLFDAP